MKEINIGIQVSSLGERCGIYTYASRLNKYLNSTKKDKYNEDIKVNSFMFANKPKAKFDVLSIQYEPGLMQPQVLQWFLNKYDNVPVVITAHHIGYLENFYPILDGIVLHSEDQILGEKPWVYRVIPHPALVYPKKDKEKLRKKYNLPLDKKIIGTAGFITGTGKNLPLTVKEILKRLNDDEFLYLITSFWKGGDFGRLHDILSVVKDMGKEKQFRIDTDFVSDEILNEKMQACDLLYAWCQIGPNDKGSQSGIAADMYGSRTKLIVKNSAHYSFIGSQDKVLIGRENPSEFADDVIYALRKEDLNDVQNPEWLSWENQVKEYIDFFQEILGE